MGRNLLVTQISTSITQLSKLPFYSCLKSEITIMPAYVATLFSSFTYTNTTEIIIG